MAIPLQMALVPLLQLYTGGAHLTLFGADDHVFPDLDLNNKPISVWLAHTAFGLPLAIFLLHNYIAVAARATCSRRPRSTGPTTSASSGGSCCRCRMPALARVRDLPVPVGVERLPGGADLPGQNQDASPLTIQLVNLVTSEGQGTELLPAAAFISMVVPLIIFFSLQRYFVRGLLAGSVKG